MEVIQNEWLDIFLKELENTKNLKLISPFITDNMVTHLLKNWHGDTIQVITRFNLNDFRSGVSSLKALERLIKKGVEIKGIKNLHSKTYIFDTKSLIITSANFTNGGFFTNYELGIKSKDLLQIKETLNYFNKLWILDRNLLELDTILEWRRILSENRLSSNIPKLKDFGTSIVKKIIGDKKHFIKFYGRGDDRGDWNWEIKDLVKGTHCHFAITFPSAIGRPTRYNDGDVVYMAYLMNDSEYAIFGKGIAQKHDRINDIASEEDIKLISWKRHYNIYIRVHSAEFLDSTFVSCPRMGRMMNELGYESFRSTKERHESGEENINPRLTLKQKPDVELSQEGAFWIEQKFQEAKNKYSTVPQTFIDSLYQGSSKV